MNYSFKTFIIAMSAIFIVSCLLAAELLAGPIVAKNAQAQRSPASVMAAAPSGGGTKDIGEELKINGQSRSLQMGMLFQKDKDKLTFGTPRTNYKDKISNKSANF